jgi:hypothetical protein
VTAAPRRRPALAAMRRCRASKLGRPAGSMATTSPSSTAAWSPRAAASPASSGEPAGHVDPVAAAQGQPAGDHVPQGPVAVPLGLERPAGLIGRELRAAVGCIGRSPAGGATAPAAAPIPPNRHTWVIGAAGSPLSLRSGRVGRDYARLTHLPGTARAACTCLARCLAGYGPHVHAWHGEWVVRAPCSCLARWGCSPLRLMWVAAGCGWFRLRFVVADKVGEVGGVDLVGRR